MTKKEVDDRNSSFVVGALRNLSLKNAQFTVAVGVSEQNELMVLSSNRLTDKEVYQILIEAANAVQGKLGGIILLN